MTHSLYIVHPTDPRLRALVTATPDGIRVELRRGPSTTIEVIEASYVTNLPFHVVLDRVNATMRAQS